MTKKDYQLIAEALKVAAERDVELRRGVMDFQGGAEPAIVWYLTVNELIVRLKADNPKFNDTIFRAAVEPRVSDGEQVIAVPGGTGTRPIL